MGLIRGFFCGKGERKKACNNLSIIIRDKYLTVIKAVCEAEGIVALYGCITCVGIDLRLVFTVFFGSGSLVLGPGGKGGFFLHQLNFGEKALVNAFVKYVESAGDYRNSVIAAD